MEKFTESDFEKIVAETHSGMTVDAFNDVVSSWLATATDKRFKRHYADYPRLVTPTLHRLGASVLSGTLAKGSTCSPPCSPTRCWPSRPWPRRWPTRPGSAGST